ncbi:unnamed protein product [Cuscuta campestris]|uniref:Replication factor A C-terminal domain-containing protein n=2 Tax=Cuscuta sect. Cleistogrammica TaxID=1824901 RepID=A0A484N7Y3_9ASTE|nr:hypothetical protein DM860_012409 [Cuscuta australis]VFQ95954.1 unnamed protein product [Cuscuta campestris]
MTLKLYRIELGVNDDTNITKFISIFDEEAEKIIGQTATSLYEMQEKQEEDSEGQLPALIENLIGQKYVFHVKLTEYNKTAYKQSFGATKVHMESILGPMKNKETPIHASTSSTSSSSGSEYHIAEPTGKFANKKRRLSVKNNDATASP